MTATLADSDANFAADFRSRKVVEFDENDALIQSIGVFRFEIYCTERGFLNASNFPTGRETDEYDEYSAHFCSFNLKDQLVGYVRLVGAGLDRAFPFQSQCPDLLEGKKLPDAQECAEISRLMVSPQYRRRRGDDRLTGVTVIEEDGNTQVARERRETSPQILLSLYREMYRYSKAKNIQYWYAAMELPLAKALQRMGFTFVQIGPFTDYYGPVATYIAQLCELEENLRAKKPKLLAWMQSQS